MKIKFVYALPVCLALGFCGCKGGGDAPADDTAEVACEKCPEGECTCDTAEAPACEKCEGECTCEG